MDLIASDREKRFDGRRVFELFPDRVRIHGNVSLQSEFETTLPLGLLAPEVTRLRVRAPGFWGGVLIVVGSIIFGLVISAVRNPPDYLVMLPFCFGPGGLILMLATVRKVEFASFNNKAGMRVLDVARAGPDAKRFKEFVQLLARQIAQAPATAE